jgi:non-ribosomal peptide synthetase component F
MRDGVLGAFEHRDAPFEAVVERLNPPRQPGVSPYIDVTLNMSGMLAVRPTVAGRPLRPVLSPALAEYETKFGLTVTMLAADGRLDGMLSYRGDRFAAADVAELARRLARLLGRFHESLGQPVRAIAAADPVPSGRSPAGAGGGRQYREFVAAQAAVRASAAGEAGLAYWEGVLAGAPAGLGVGPPERPGPHGAVPLRLDDDLLERLRLVQRERGVSWFMVVATALAAVLHGWAGQDDLTLGCPVASRDAEFADVVGPCMNTVVLRSRCGGGLVLGDLLGQMRDGVLGAFEHRDAPFEAVVERLNPPRQPGVSPYIDVTIVTDAGVVAPPVVAGVRLTPVTAMGDDADYMTKFGLTVAFRQSDGRLEGVLFYRGDRFAAADAAELARRLARLLGEFHGLLGQQVRALGAVGAKVRPAQRQEPERPALARSPGPPAGDLERRIAGIWSAVLRKDRVGVHDNFFDLGGNSRLLAGIHAKLEAELQVSLPIARLFEFTTVSALARALTSADDQSDRASSADDGIAERAARARGARAARRKDPRQR